MKRRILSLLLTLCLIVGLLPAVAIPHAHAETETVEPGGALPKNYTLTLNGTDTFTIENYDVPVYFKDTTKTGNFKHTYTDESGTSVTEWLKLDYTAQSTSGADATNYNGKLVWHTGDDGPTLYMKSLVIDNYNDTYGWRYRSTSTSTSWMHTGLFAPATAPLKIVLEEGESRIEARDGLRYNADLEIESVGDASLKIWGYGGGINPGTNATGYAGDTAVVASLTLNANLDVSMYYRDKNASGYAAIMTYKADITINGGNIRAYSRRETVPSSGNSHAFYAISALTSGNLIVNGGNVYASTLNSGNKTNAAILFTGGTVTINGGTVEVGDCKGCAGIRSTAITINGGHVISNPVYGGLLLTGSTGAITINGGIVEGDSSASSHYLFMHNYTDSNSKTQQAAHVPILGEGAIVTAGSSKSAAKEISDIAGYSWKGSYIKVEVPVPTCEHTNTTTNEETITAATCTVAGSKKVTVTCDDCGETISETTEEIKALGHTEAAPVEENKVDSDLNNKGSYDSVVYCSVCNIELKRETFVINEKDGAVASVNGTKYATLDEAIKAANALTGEVTIEILGKAEYTDASPNLGSSTCTAIHFVGKTADAEFSLLRNGSNGYVSGTNAVAVTYKDLILSKPEGGHATDAGFRNIGFCTFYVGSVSYTNCTFANGAVASGSKTTYTGCTFKATHDRYGMFAYGNADVTVEDCVFDALRGIKLWAEGHEKTTALTVKNSDFSKLTQKPAVVLTSGESVTLEGNTYSDTGVFELDLDGVPNGTPVTSTDPIICVNDNGACGVLVDGKIYTTVAQAAAVATEGSTVTLLHESAETVELPEGVTLDKNGFTAAGVTEYKPREVTVATLEELLNALADDSNDLPIVITEKITIPAGTTVALDLNGKTVNSVYVDGSTTNHIYAIYNYGDLTITGNGEINSRGIYNYGNLTLNGGAINAIDGNGGYAVNNQSGSTFVMNGGTVAATYEDDYQSSKGGYDATALKVPSGCVATLNGGKIVNVCDFTYAIDVGGTLTIPATSTIEVIGTHGAIAVNGGTTTINAGTFKIPADEYSRTDNVLYVSGGKLIVNGGTFIGDSDTASGGTCVWDAVGGVTINGGSFSGSSGGDVWGATGTTIYGGTFANLTETKYIAEGYELDENGAVVKSVTYVAEVNGVKYEDLQEAIIAAAPNGTVELLCDVTVEEWIMISETLTIGNGTIITLEMNGLTIDGNGHTLTINNVESAANGGHIFYDGDYNICDLTIVMGDNVNGPGITSGTISNVTFIGGRGASGGAAVHVSDGIITGVHAGNVTIEGCTFKNNGGAICYETAQNGLVVNNNTFEIASGANVILLRGTEQFTNNTVVSGRTVNVVSGSPTVSGNDFGNVRLKVYNEATATIANNTINNLVFNDDTKTQATFENNTLSESAQAALEAVTKSYVAEVGGVQYATLEEAFAAATEGATITLLTDATPVLKSQRAITKAAIIDLGGNTLTLTEDDLYFGTTTFKNGTIVVDPSVKPSTAVFWMFANQTLTFDAVKLVATGVTGTYLIGLDGNNSDLNLINGSEILVENTTALDLDIICVNASTGNDILVENSKVNVTNLDGRVFFRGNYTISGNSDIDLTGITKAGFRIEAGQTLTIADTATVDIVGEPRDGGIHLTDVTATYTKADTATVNATVNKPIIYVAQIGEQKFENLTDAIAVVQPGQTITLIGDVTLTETLTLPAGITLNGNGKTITGEVWAAGNLTFQGHTKVTNFNAGYNKPVITIGEGACLELIGTGRMVIGHGATFNITGSIADAKTADKATIQPSLIIPGASFTGAGVTFNVTNAYIKATAYCSSKNSAANGTFNFNITNSIWDQTNTLVFSEPTSGKDPVVNFNLKNSVLTSTSHLVFSVTKGEIVFDNSNVNVGSYKQLENRSNLTIKNGSVVYASVQTSSNAKNPGTTTVDNATYVTTGTFGGSDLGIGKLILKNNASFTTGTLAKVDVAIDASSELIFTKIDAANTTVALGAGASLVAPEGLTVTTVEGYIVEYVNGAYVSKQANYVAQIGEQKFESVAAALAYAKEAGLTDVTIVLIGETDASTTDSFDLVYTQLFDSVTFKQADASKVYYLASVYTGSRTNGGKFIFDGVNLVVTEQYMFEGNVVLTNNSYIASVAEANCFIYNGETTIEPGSMLKGVIEDFRGGDMVIDGGKTDGSYNTVPSLQDAILIVNWGGDKLILKNGAYVKINAANEVGRLTVNNGAAVELYASKLETVEYINLAEGAEFYMDVASLVTTKKITGAGKIVVNVAGIDEAKQIINADMSGFTGTIELVGGNAIYEITATGLIVEKGLAGSGTEADPYLINSVEDLILFRDSVNAGETKYNAPGVYVALNADIDMAGATWNRGIGDGINATFDGIFDGKNFSITNLNFAPKADSDGYLCGGLFGYTFGAAVIKNLTLENITVTATEAGHNVGVLVGFANNNGGKLNVSNVIVKNVTIDAPKAFGVGAIVGYSYRAMGTIENCSVEDANITGYSFVGGITGYSYSNAVITDCSVNNATITATSKGAGGIAGLALSGDQIFNNTVTNTTVTAPVNWGYVVGELGASSAIIYNNNAAEPQIGGDYATGEAYVAKIGDKYYTTLEAAIKDGGEIELLTDIEASAVILLDKNVTINGNGHKILSSATRVFRVTTSDVEITLNDVNMVSSAAVAYPNDVRGVAVDPSLTNVKLTLNNCSVDFTDASACDWAYAVNVAGNGTGHTVTINGGAYEGANVINVHGANNTIIVKNATLTSLYPNADLYYGAAIWVLQKQGSTVIATGNTYNGANAIAYNLGTGTTLEESNNTDNTTLVVAKIGNTYYTSLADAFAAGGEVKLLRDIALNESVVVPAGKTVTLDLNGKTVSMADASGATAALLINKGTLTINDTVGGGKLTFNTTTPSAANAYASNTISNYGILTINGGIIENTSVGGGACYALDNYAGSTATINGGKLSAAKTAVRIFNWTNGDAAKATLTVNGGEILTENGYGINLNLGNAPAVELAINGGTVTTNDTVYNLGVYIVNKGSAENLVVKVTGGTINGQFALNGLTCTTMAKDAVSISGGTMDGIVCYGDPAYGFVSGGTFKAPVEKAFCVEGYQPKDNGNGTYGVVEHTCSFNSETFDATCTEDGKIVYTCSCGETYEEVIPAKGHTEETVPGKDATCTEAGLTEGKKCSVCGEILVAQEEIAAKGHTEEIIPGKDATCNETGLTEGKKCTVCGEITVAQEEIPATGHKYDDAADGECNVCGAGRATITVDGNKVTVHVNGVTNVKTHTFYVEGKDIANIDDWYELKATGTLKSYSSTEFVLNQNGDYVLRLEYYDKDGVRQTVSYPVTIDYTFAPSCVPEFKVDDNIVTVIPNGATNVKVHAFYVEGKNVADINNWSQLKAADPDFDTYSKGVLPLTKIGKYVLRAEYKDAEGVKNVISAEITIEIIPVSLTVNNDVVVVNVDQMANVTGVKVFAFYIEGKSVSNIYDWYALKEADPNFETYTKDTFVLPYIGEYVLRVQYTNAAGEQKATSYMATTSVIAPEIINVGNKVALFTHGLTIKQVHVFYVEGKDIADINDWNELKNEAVSYTAYNKSQFVVKNSGDYVLRVVYEDADGIEHKVSQLITIQF